MSSKYKRKAKKLPEAFKKYFWDVSYRDVSKKPLNKFTLERIMNFGNLKALNWLLRSVPRKKIKEVARSSRELDKKTKNFWKVIYGR
ncbi:MAG: hypothetical protein ABIJ26_04090 [Candidatus Margulisiibacteriota bacterium]